MNRFFFILLTIFLFSYQNSTQKNQIIESIGKVEEKRTIQEIINDAKAREVYCKDLIMLSEHVKFFAEKAGWNREGFLPELSNKEVWQQLMDESMVYYYENTAQVCSFCLTGKTAENWGGLAYCNAANQYSNVFLAERYQSIRFMDSYIQEMDRK